ncbi:MAG TPA: hypothetical protein VIM19_12595 [Actinomycetes bacterium]
MPRRYELVGAFALFVGGAAVVLQYLVTPVSGSMGGAELLATVTEHRTAMGWALALDFPVLLAAPAFLFIGYLAQARTSVLASIATAFLFFPFVVSLPAIFGLDGLAFLASEEPNQVAMVHLLDSWQGSTWFALSVLPYVLLQIVGGILLAIALRRVTSVPSWVALATGAWPLFAVAGQESGVRVIAVIGYALLFATWAVFAMLLLRGRQPAAAQPALVTA